MSAGNQQGRLPNPWYISGFVDGDGSFHVAIYRDERMKTDWKIIPEFHVSQRKSSQHVLHELTAFFGCGYVKENHHARENDVTFVYVVRNRDDLTTKILPFFQRYPLRTEKRMDYERFSQIVELMNMGEHRDSRGVKRIIKIAYAMNGQGRYRRQRIV